MSDAFLSSDDFDEQAHQLYNQGRYDEALETLKDGLAIYPSAVELHIGMGYAHLAREEFAWSRRAFEQALALDADHEDALAGMGEALLAVGDQAGALQRFERLLQLGFQEDHEMMLQAGRALFRSGLLAQAYRYFDLAQTADANCSEAAACLGYVSHRLGRDGGAFFWLKRTLAIDPKYVEARIYLANMLYDRGESGAALTHFEKTDPDDHFDELGLWRTIELKKTLYRLADDDLELSAWVARLGELAPEPDPTEDLLAEIEAQQPDGTVRDPNQLELFGVLMADLPGMQRKHGRADAHQVATLGGSLLRGTWDEILLQLKAAEHATEHLSLSEFMAGLARSGREETGVIIPLTDAEAFIRGSAEAGVLRIVQ
ncbi:MAG: tetratricopeptide repeat protein [Gemmatimonadales bacterium]|nr:tetratricopeptide repeat protein [Gemmatimonadales bacterium]